MPGRLMVAAGMRVHRLTLAGEAKLDHSLRRTSLVGLAERGRCPYYSGHGGGASWGGELVIRRPCMGCWDLTHQRYVLLGGGCDKEPPNQWCALRGATDDTDSWADIAVGTMARLRTSTLGRRGYLLP